MIPKVHQRGTRVYGLLAYLFGPGKAEEHIDPRIVAVWAGGGTPADLQPNRTTTGRHDLHRLTDLLEIPVRAGRRPPARFVWHASLRTHPTDPRLSDDQWRHIAAEVMARVGLAPHADERAVRWIGVRHADDHIHLVATLVRQDWRTAWAHNDYRLAQAACRDIETRYHLYRVAPPGQGSRVWPTAAELNKATRQGRPVAPREQLRRLVRDTATVAVDEPDFYARLARAGVRVRLRYSTRNPDEVTGYAVGLSEHTTGTGEVIFFSGGKLAADMSLPRLRRRWHPDAGQADARAATARLHPTRAQVYERGGALLADLATHLTASAGTADLGAAVRGGADVLAAMAAAWEPGTGGPLTTAAELLDRATHRPHPATTSTVRGPSGRSLRAVARLINLLGPPTSDQELAIVMQLLRSLTGFIDALADLHREFQQLHRADAAHAAAVLVRGYTPPVHGTGNGHSLAPVPVPVHVTVPGRWGRNR